MSKPAKTKKLCGGCHNDFYNGSNDLGVPECWSYGSARVAKKKFVHMDQPPPWTQPAQWTLDCHRADGFITVAQGVTC